MEVPVGEAQQRFAEAMAAAERGETVVFTRDGAVVMQLTPASARPRFRTPTAQEAAATKRAMGFDDDEELWPAEFDDPAFSRQVLGLE